MNKFNVIFCLAFVVAAFVMLAEADLFSRHTAKPAAINGEFGAVDVIENGIPNYAAPRDNPCAKSKTSATCNECCVSHGFNKGYNPKVFDRVLAKGIRALNTHCTCVKDQNLEDE